MDTRLYGVHAVCQKVYFVPLHCECAQLKGKMFPAFKCNVV